MFTDVRTVDMSKSKIKLSWQCHICKASFFRENLLRMHHNNFHRNSPVHSPAIKKSKMVYPLSSNTSIKETGAQTNRTLENTKQVHKVYYAQPTEVSENFEGNSLTGCYLNDNRERECYIDGDCSEREIEDCSEKEIEDNVKIKPKSEEFEEQGDSDEEMAVVVVRKDGSMFMVKKFDEEGQKKPNNSEKSVDESNKEISSESQPVTDDDMPPSPRHASENISGQYTQVLGDKVMKVRNQIKEKRRNVNTVEQSRYGQRPSFQCKRCEQVFPTKHERRLHLETHSRDLRFFCKDCGRGFRKSASLLLHSNVHVEGSHHQCPHCHKYYRTAIYLKKHIKLHDPSQHTHQCPSCPKRFAFPEWLRYHMRTHSEDTPHVCTICGKRYQQAQGLKYHMLMHEGKKPHQCSYCGKYFLQRSTLVTHMRLHNREKPVPCSCLQPGFNEDKTSRELFQHHKLCPKNELQIMGAAVTYHERISAVA